MQKGIIYIRLLDTATVLGQSTQNCSKIVDLLGYDYDGGCTSLTRQIEFKCSYYVNVCVVLTVAKLKKLQIEPGKYLLCNTQQHTAL